MGYEKGKTINGKEIGMFKKKVKKKNYLIWIDKNGTEIKVHKMTDDYITNCMNMIIRSYSPEKYTNTFGREWLIKHGAEYLKVFSRELEKRLMYRKVTVPGLIAYGRYYPNEQK